MSEIARQYGAQEGYCSDFDCDWDNLIHLLGYFEYNSGSGCVLEYFLSIGCDIEDRNSFGETLLLFAVRRLQPRSVEFCKALLSRQASISAVDRLGRGALYIALYGYIDSLDEYNPL